MVFYVGKFHNSLVKKKRRYDSKYLTHYRIVMKYSIEAEKLDETY